MIHSSLDFDTQPLATIRSSMRQESPLEHRRLTFLQLAPVRLHEIPYGHNFIVAYLGTKESREKIKSDILAVSKETAYPFRGNAFKVEILSNDDDDLLFDMTADPASDDTGNISKDENNLNLQTGIFSCSKIKNSTYTLSINPTFIQSERCPCPFQVKITYEGQEKHFSGTANIIQKAPDQYYLTMNGALPLITIEKSDKDYKISVGEARYPDQKLQ